MRAATQGDEHPGRGKGGASALKNPFITHPSVAERALLAPTDNAHRVPKVFKWSAGAAAAVGEVIGAAVGDSLARR